MLHSRLETRKYLAVCNFLVWLGNCFENCGLDIYQYIIWYSPSRRSRYCVMMYIVQFLIDKLAIIYRSCCNHVRIIIAPILKYPPLILYNFLFIKKTNSSSCEWKLNLYSSVLLVHPLVCLLFYTLNFIDSLPSIVRKHCSAYVRIQLCVWCCRHNSKKVVYLWKSRLSKEQFKNRRWRSSLLIG